MMQNCNKTNVILYCRVSSDEQAEGSSLDVQEQNLRRYCEQHKYHIIQTYREDESAKTFNKRPEMTNIINYVKKHRGEIQRLLFLRWDRFSRDLLSAVKTLEWFRDMGVEPNAIEGELDYNNESWPVLLGVNIGIAQADNIKRSKATKDGIHGTLLKGKCSNKAPRGYKNVRISKHDCYVEINKEKAPLIKLLFEEVAKGVETPCRIRRRLAPSIPESSFFDMLRNPFYIGKIKVPAYKDEPEQIVQGIHDALIDEATFYKVQDILDGKQKKNPKLSKAINPDLYLRKFLVCPICGHALTGAVSKGNGGEYAYYNCCENGKHLRRPALDVNESFARYVGGLVPNTTVLNLYKEILDDLRNGDIKQRKQEIQRVEAELVKCEERINRVTDAFFDGDISKEDRDNALSRYKKERDNIQNHVNLLKEANRTNIEPKLDYSISLIDNLEAVFRDAPVETKIKVLSSMFPEKIEFDGKAYRTTKYN